MTILSATKATFQKKLIEKRNLFGLGVTSLIAACGADKAANDVNIEPLVPPGEREEEEPVIILPFEAERLSKATNSGFRAAPGGSSDQLTVTKTATQGADTPKTLTFTDGTNTDNSLGIYKLTTTEDQAEDQFDLVIASPKIDTDATITDASDQAMTVNNDDHETGRIFIFWDIANIKDETIGRSVDPATNLNKYLEVKGARKGDQIGTLAPEFLQIASDTEYDMVIRSRLVEKEDSTGAIVGGVGAIYILWDVAKYANKAKTIDLADANDDSHDFLAVYGGVATDKIGGTAPKFLQIGGKENNYDMVIASVVIAKPGFPYYETNYGAIYILWDIADYAGDSQVIDLGILSQATSGLLAIHGSDRFSNIGSSASNILYDTAGELTNIDGDAAGTNDIAFQDENYIYILFGDKIAEVDGTTKKVTSKAIDLAKVDAAFDVDPPDAGFFKYNFGAKPTIISDDVDATIISIEEADTATGYRFASGGHNNRKEYTTLAKVEGDYKDIFSSVPLSDADADLGVWDIA